MPKRSSPAPELPRRRGLQRDLAAVLATVLLMGGWLVVLVGAEPEHAHAAEHSQEGLPAPPPRGSDLERVLKGLMCRCGCNLTVHACQGSMTCDVAEKMRADAETKLASGLTVPQVFDAFASDYGEQVLAAPTKSGFNLTAWIVPFVVLGAGAALVTAAVTAWRRPHAAAREDEPVPAVDPTYLAAIEREVEREV